MQHKKTLDLSQVQRGGNKHAIYKPNFAPGVVVEQLGIVDIAADHRDRDAAVPS